MQKDKKLLDLVVEKIRLKHYYNTPVSQDNFL